MRDSVEWHQDICVKKGETKEKFVIKTVPLTDYQKLELRFCVDISHLSNPIQKVALISRYPLNAGKRWVDENEREALEWDNDEHNRTITLADRIENAM
jgi:hypothetical protein